MKKRNKTHACLLLILPCLLLTGCELLPRAREMGDMALLRTMGIDRAEDGVAVTVSTGPRARGLQGEREDALTLTAEAGSLSAAALALQGQSDSYVFFGYVDQLLLGEELVRDSVLPVLEYFARDGELGLGAQLWVVRKDTARAAVDSGGGEGVDSRLSTLRTDGELGVAAVPRTAGEVYADLLEKGSAYVPALSPGDGESASLEGRGYAVLKGGALAGFLDGDAARGLELLIGRPALDAAELDLDGRRIVAEITGARTACELVRMEWAPEALKLSCRVEAKLAEYNGPVDAADRAQLEELLAARELERLNAALEQLQDWEADCAGLGGGANWPERFGQMKVTVEMGVTIRE